MQRWNERKCKVENDSSLGREIQSLAKKNLHHVVNSEWECGWSDGGCRIFAEALRIWSGNVFDLYAILHESKPGEWKADHVLASFANPETGERVYLDAEGIADEISLLSRWEKMEDRHGCRIAEFDYEEGESPFGPPCDTWLSGKISEKMNKRFGTFSPSMMDEAFLHQKRKEAWNEFAKKG